MPVSEAEFAVLAERFDNQDKTLARIEALLLGNGKEGLIVRFDRVERVANSLNKFMYFIGTALLLGAGGFIWALIVHRIQIVP